VRWSYICEFGTFDYLSKSCDASFEKRPTALSFSDDSFNALNCYDERVQRNDWGLQRRIPMATIQPKGERVRQAVKWISENRKEDDKRSVYRLIQDASLRFTLSPKEEDFLRAFYEEGSN